VTGAMQRSMLAEVEAVAGELLEQRVVRRKRHALIAHV
jgi:hypothetical protein